ncbi:MAG: phosphatidylserine decarboxylase [Ignavibacteriales bacterium]|nr:phosphatidylserine decarboxylase [Ignavibacteriales bacterium]
MKRISPITYIDRCTGRTESEPVFAAGFLDWLHNTSLGHWANELLFKQKIFSRFYGWFHRTRLSKRKVQRFVSKMNVNLGEAVVPSGGFCSFNDFFTRRIDLSRRPIDKDDNVCVAPADGRVLAYQTVAPNQTFRIKQSTFNLAEFLRNEELTRKFAGGSMVISRLYLSDYHHFHFPDSGIPHPASTIPGKYYAVSPYSMQRILPFYAENHRMVTIFDSEHFGEIAMVEVGALTVGSIRQCFTPDVSVSKGARKGFFELGGSTVALLFTRGTIRFDEDLCKNTEQGMETFVRLGDSIGRT